MAAHQRVLWWCGRREAAGAREGPLLKSGRRIATDPSKVQPRPRKSDDSKSWAVLHRTSAPYVLSTSDQLVGRCASRCSSHLGWEHFCQYGRPMYDREVRSENSRRKVRNKGEQPPDDHP